MFPDDRAAFGTHDKFPNTGTTYRLTEHFHYWTKHARLNAIVQPQQFVEIGEEHAKEVGVVAGERVKVSSNREHIVAVALVTKRIKPLTVEGKKVHRQPATALGLQGPHAAGLSRQHADAFRGRRELQTPEFKSFLVKVEKA